MQNNADTIQCNVAFVSNRPLSERKREKEKVKYIHGVKRSIACDIWAAIIIFENDCNSGTFFIK